MDDDDFRFFTSDPLFPRRLLLVISSVFPDMSVDVEADDAEKESLLAECPLRVMNILKSARRLGLSRVMYPPLEAAIEGRGHQMARALSFGVKEKKQVEMDILSSAVDIVLKEVDKKREAERMYVEKGEDRQISADTKRESESKGEVKESGKEDTKRGKAKKKKRTIIDIGSGKGYFLQMMSYRHGYDSAGIEASECNCKGAQRRSDAIEKALKNEVKKKREKEKEKEKREKKGEREGAEDEKAESGMNGKEEVGEADDKIGGIDSSGRRGSSTEREEECSGDIDFGRCITIPSYLKLEEANIQVPTLLSEVDMYGDNTQICITGLHPCGDLGSFLARTFKCLCDGGKADTLMAVSCCYHLLSEMSEVEVEDGKRGYPLSHVFHSSLPTLGRDARMIACQAISRWTTSSCEEVRHSQTYRAMLQVVFSRVFPADFARYSIEERRFRLPRRGKRDPVFAEYCVWALRGMQLLHEGDDEKEEEVRKAAMQVYEECMPSSKHLAVFWALRSIAGRVVEAAILLDRHQYLRENNMEAALLAIFPPTISPRNMLLFGHSQNGAHVHA
uniref:Methyltransferase domain-containing protein n=1 Tax=Palpitomonas bilix TaxID=652834 RepID=A0A7S3DJV1_9EUKA